MQNQHNIIILDDDISVCETVKIALSSLFSVEYYNTIPKLRDILKTDKKISLLILDYKINDTNGIEFYKKEIAQLKIPTILISGFIGQNKTIEEYTELNKLFIKILEKPFDIFELIRFIQTTLQE